MSGLKRAIPMVQVVLILPAAVFMAALAVRGAGPPGAEPAASAQAVVMWYAARLWTLWVLLAALPLAAVGLGCPELLRRASDEAGPHRCRGLISADGTVPFVGVLTVGAGIILVIVALHVMMN